MRGFLFVAGAFFLSTLHAQIPAFPGAEGAGMFTTGGRGGSVYVVTNLTLNGPGGFADAVSQPNRIIVFAVSGIIDLGDKTFRITQTNLTVAGQSAPGEGICFKDGGISVRSNNIIMMYLRSRRGFITNGDSGDCMSADPDDTTTNIMFNHLSTSWATDENMSVTKPNLATVQYCIASEGLDYTNALQTPPNHSEGSLWGTDAPNGFVSMHHMLYAHNRLRNPRTTAADNTSLSNCPINDLRNCVIYDALEYTTHTGNQLVRMNSVNNYYKDGPSTQSSASQVVFTMMNDASNQLYLNGNYVYGNPEKSASNWLAVNYENNITEAEVRTNTAFITPPVTTETALAAYSNVLENAGAILPARDSVDLRIVNDVINGTGQVIPTETNLPPDERWPDYRSLPPPQDSDADGIPDYWEKQFGLNPSNAADSRLIAPNGYAYIENYLNNTNPTNGTTPIVYIYANVSRCAAGVSVGQWWVARNGSTNNPLTVNYTVSGEAVAGTDYTTLPSFIIIPAGASKTALFLNPAIVNTDKMAVVTLQTGSSNYFTGCPLSSLVVIPAAADTDGDGLPDAWETMYFGNATNADPNADSDGDGFTNLQEYEAGTNPTNRDDCLKILSSGYSGGNFSATFASAPGRLYQLERRDDLAGGSWTAVVTNIQGNGAPIFVPDSSGVAGRRFYRIALVP